MLARTVADLPHMVAAPGPHMAVLVQGQAVAKAAVGLDNVLQFRNLHGDQHTILHRGDALLALAVGTAGVHRAVLHDKERIHIAALDIQDVMAVHTLGRLHRFRDDLSAFDAQLAVAVIAPAPDDAVHVHAQAKAAAHADHQLRLFGGGTGAKHHQAQGHCYQLFHRVTPARGRR